MRPQTLTLLAAMALATGTAHAQVQRIVLQGNGAPQVFTDIDAALAAAQPNDKLYFSGGTFSSSASITISTPVHFIGAGIAPDSSSVTSTTTIATTAGDVVITTGASGSTFTGIRFNPNSYFYYGTSAADDDPTGLLFERCTFDCRVYTVNGSPVGASTTAFNECIFHSLLNGQAGVTATLTRCVLDYQAGTGAEVSGFDGGGLTMRHCVGLGTRVGNSTNSTLENCVFTRTSAPIWQSGGSILTNNLVVSPSLVSNMTPGPTVGNVLGVTVTDIFISESNTDFEWSDDLHLQALSVGVGMATDGTDVGIYGTSAPFKAGAVPYNPHFRSAVIAPATNGNGDLPVNIRVAAQAN